MQGVKKTGPFLPGLVKIFVCFCFILFFFLVTAPTASSQQRSYTRQGGVDIFLIGQQVLGDKTRATDAPIDLEVDNTFVFGGGVGVNLNDYINLNFDTWIGKTDINARGTGFSSKTDSNLFGVDVNLDYHLFRGQLTPVFTGGIGFVKFSGSVAGLNFGETDFSYNLGGGIRWDISSNFFLKGIYRFTWTELEDTQNKLLLDGFSFSIGYVFR